MADHHLTKVVAIVPTAQKHRLHEAIHLLSGQILQEVDQSGSAPVVAGEPTNIVGEPLSAESEYLVQLGLEESRSQQIVTSDVNQQSQVVAIVPTAQKHRLHEAIHLLSGQILQEVDQSGSAPVVAGEPTNIVGEPLSAESEYLVQLGLEESRSQQIVTSDVNQQSRSCMLGRPQEHTCTCNECQAGFDHSHGADEQGLLDRAQEAGFDHSHSADEQAARAREVQNEFHAAFAQLGDQPLPPGFLC